MNTMTKELMTPKYLAAKIADATDRNDHTGAVELLAEFVGGDFPKLAAAVRQIHDIEGFMPHDVINYRRELKRRMMEDVMRNWGGQTYELIRKSF